MQKGFVKCLACPDRATIVFKSKFSNAKKGYCRRHYGNGKWLERQKLFPKDRWVIQNNRRGNQKQRKWGVHKL